MNTQAAERTEHRYQPVGSAAELFASRAGEVLMSGAAGTGKSRACMEKVHAMALLNDGMRALICRKTATSLGSTALVTWREYVAKEALESGEVRFYGGSQQEAASYRYGNGSVVVVGGMDKATRIMSSEYDCVTGDTLVVSPSEIQRAYGRPFSGQLVTITTARGNQLTGTPNHPVLTDHGWRALGSLREGDHVVSRCGGQQKATGADPHVADQPAPIADVTRALALANPGCTKRAVTVPVDFHGDGAHGYVDVVTTARLFHDRAAAAFLNPVPHGDGEGGHLEQSALMSDGPGVKLRDGRLPASVARSLLAASLTHSLAVSVGGHPSLTGAGAGLGEAALPLAIGVADVTEGLPFGFGAPRDAAGGHLPLEPSVADVDGGGDVQQPPLASEVALDRVVKVSVADAGPGRHVYNLQTGDHWYYANNIVSHNCIYVQEATELLEDDWEALTTRLRNGRVSFQQLMADCNPGPPQHWLNQRALRGQTQMILCRHEDNPRLYHDGQWTTEGDAYVARLENLTGVRYLRLRKGIWAAAEGLVYDTFDPAIHFRDRMGMPPADWDRYLSVDLGYINPTVVQWWAVDHDGRAYMYREIYMSHRIVEDHAQQIMEVVRRGDGHKPDVWPPFAIICDHDAEDRATLERKLGFSTKPARKAVSEGIQAVAERLRVQGDGKPRLYLCRDALVERDPVLHEARRPVCTSDEIVEYIWDKGGNTPRESPLKQNDHGMDAMRYLVAELDLEGRPSYRFFSLR